ncbi:EscF/YscF/HrpA family type III secretion system needle major subunit [Providencia rettgeri]
MADSSTDVISGLDTSGRWGSSKLETEGTGKNDLGMIYRTSASISAKATKFGDELNTLLASTNLEVDNPLVLAKITAMSGNYNMAHQLQSNFMKSIKDTDQAIIRNV